MRTPQPGHDRGVDSDAATGDRRDRHAGSDLRPPRRGQIARILTLSVAGPRRADPLELARLVEGTDLREVIRRATYHGVVGPLSRRLRDRPGADPAAMAALDRLYRASVAVELKMTADLATLADVLDGAGSPWLLFKGPVLSHLYHQQPGMRRYADLDVLVPRGAFVDAVTALEAAGCALLDRNWRLMAVDERAQVHPSLPLGTEVDLHWHVLNRGEVRSSFDLDVSDLFERSRPIALDGVRVRTFGPVDTLVHLALHAGLAGGDRLVWIADIERVIAGEDLDWDEVVDRARAWGASTLVGVMLDRARRILGAEVAPDVVAALTGRPARALGAVMDRLWPPGRSTGQRSPSWIWMRSLRSSGPDSVRIALRKLRRGEGLRAAVASWLSGRADRSERPATSSAFHDPDEPVRRAEYLDVVRDDPGTSERVS